MDERRRDSIGRMMPPRVPRAFEMEVRAKALAAARYALDNRTTRDEAAEKFSVNVHIISEALILLKHGTEQEIDDVTSGKVGLKRTIHSIRKRAPEVRLPGKTPVKGKEALEEMKMDGAVWVELRDALKAITGLPRPADVVRIVKKNGQRTEVVDRHLMAAFGWITEFSDEWTK